MSIKQNVARAKANYDEAYEAGKKAENDANWDRLQEYGTRIYYDYFFAGSYVTQEYIDSMKYPIVFPTEATVYVRSCVGMFQWAGRRRTTVLDLTNVCKKIDFSKCKSATNTFANGRMDNITADFSGCEILSQTFSQNDMSDRVLTNVTIKVSEKCVFDNTFTYCSSLISLIFMEGSVIGQKGLDLQRSTKLSKASFYSIINALSNTTSGLSIVLSLDAVNKAFETSEGANDGSTSPEWLALRATKENWGINYA